MKKEIKTETTGTPRIRTGCEPLDSLLGGGFERGVISQIYGEAGSGKTNVCLQTIVNCILDGYGVVFIDTEGFSTERLYQIAGKNAQRIIREMIVYEPIELSQQLSVIKNVEHSEDESLGLVVVDSMTSLYRPYATDTLKRRELTEQLLMLQRIARRHNTCVLITNQVYTDVESGEFCPIGGTMISYISKAILKLEKMDGGRRRATIMKHRSRPEGEYCEFMITDTGII
jgi:DNA repair protein RadB